MAGYGTIQIICLFALRKQPFCVHSVFGGISYCSCLPIVTFLVDNQLCCTSFLRFERGEDSYLFREFGGFSSCSFVPIVTFPSC